MSSVLKLIPNKPESAKLIEVLEKVLEDAKAGRCTAAIVIADYGDTSRMKTAGYTRSYDIVASLEAHKIGFIRDEIIE